MPVPGRGIAGWQRGVVDDVDGQWVDVTIAGTTYTVGAAGDLFPGDPVWVLFAGRTGVAVGAAQGTPT